MISYNVENVWFADRNNTPGDRDDATAKMLLAYDPDFICLQEFDPLYRNATNSPFAENTDFSKQYTEVCIKDVEDVDDDKNTDENVSKDMIYNPIFYDHSKYTQKASGYVWMHAVADDEYEYMYDENGEPLSKEYNYPGYHDDYKGEKVEGTTYGRCLVWAVLQDAEGDLFLVANVHFSQQDLDTEGDNPLATRSKRHTAEATFVSTTLKAEAVNYEDITVLVGGDMNSVISDENCGVDTMLDNGFTHTYNLASDKNNVESYHGGTAPTTGYLKYAIDHILTLNADLNVRSFYVLNDAALYSVSDHLPVKMSFYK